MGVLQRIIGKAPDQTQRCAFCQDRRPAAYQLSEQYIRELRGNVNRDCVHFECLFARQNQLRRWLFAQILLDDAEQLNVLPHFSDNNIVFDDSASGRALAKDEANKGLPFFWDGRQYFIEPQRSEWLRENTTYPRNFLVALYHRQWLLYMPRNQALLFKLTWGGVLEDACRI